MKKQPTFFEGTGLALIVSIIGAVSFFSLSTLFGSTGVIQLIIAALCLIYVVYLLSRSGERIGRVTVISAWLLIAGLSWLFVSSLLLYIIIHLGMIWFIRSLYFYSSILSSLADLALTGFSLAVAIWAWSMSQSVFLSFWCFFLVQSLFTLIPKQITKYQNRSTINVDTNDPFEYAHRTAEVALHKLTTTR
jgi:hypothetical protein